MSRVRILCVRGVMAVVSSLAMASLVAGCGSLSGGVHADSPLLATRPPVETPQAGALPGPTEGAVAAPSSTAVAVESTHDAPATVGVGDGDAGTAPTLAQTQRAPQEKISIRDEEEKEEYDPWEGFNETMFEFNRRLDRYLLKPAAKVYNVAVPEPFQVLIANGFDNIAFVPRTVNSLLQGKWGGAGREVGRFLINSTLGIGGLFDAAKYWGIEKSREDFGQTLAVWGAGPGPYLILPFLEPLTVRDGIGKAVDGAMDPLSYVLPFFWTRIGMKAGDIVNDRALNLDLFQGFEESVIDMYSAVRNAYLRRREQLIKE